MAYIPDQPVARRVEDVVQGDRQFDDAQAGAKMASGHRNCADRFAPQFVSNLPELPFVQSPRSAGELMVSRSGVVLMISTLLSQAIGAEGQDELTARTTGTMQAGLVLHNSSDQSIAPSASQPCS